MKAQIIGFGNVGRNLLELIIEEEKPLKCLGIDLKIVSISDSKGTAIDENGLNLQTLLKKKKEDWQGYQNYRDGFGALEAINKIESDVVIELTPSTNDGEPGLSHITAALKRRKDVVTANKGPMVVAYSQLTELAGSSNRKLLYEATVSAQLPVFCLLDSCFIVDKVEKIEGIFNATTNFIIGEIEKGKTFEEALQYAIKAGWAETNYSDDVDGVDSARKLVILANRIYGGNSKLQDVKMTGIRDVGKMVQESKTNGMKVKLLCELICYPDKPLMSVQPRMVPLNDPFATINEGNMGIRFNFKNSQKIFISSQFLSPRQTAYAVLNDLVKTDR